ncbi:MAG TPA: FISUMP domain-containing protein, partial [Bacteroidales bacterium]|nr:FISUMP domain-containing protein [Bacteroidales bacterium]
RLDYDKANGYSVRCLKGCWPQPSQANAGPDQVNIPGTSTTLAGNTPTYGIGVWHIITGTGGTVTDTTSPTSGITGLAGNAYSLSWTITTQCGSSLDTVLVSFAAGFSCGDTLVDSRDGQSYATVLMGDQCWMAENMNIGTRINSTQGGFQQLDNGTIEKYCYDNDEAKCDTYGGMYEWPEAMQYVTTEGAQGICPPGWHIPTDGEWSVLSFYLGGSTVAGGKMKTTGTIEAGTGLWFDPNTGATNESGFSGLPGGDRFILDGSFYDLGNNGQFWSSSQYSTDDAWYRFLNYSLAFLFRNYLYKETGFSVRCLKETP